MDPLLLFLLMSTITEGNSVFFKMPFECLLNNTGTNPTLYILPIFNSTYNITSYTVSGPNIECAPCTPGVQCQCIVEANIRTNVTIMTFNGPSQVGPPTNSIIATACPAEDLGIGPDDHTTFTCGGLLAVSGGGSVDIGNGRACYNSSTLGSVATYQCDQSYILSASLQRTCQCDGTWDGTAPECIPSISTENIAFLVLSVLLWVIAGVLAVLASVADISLLMYEILVKKAKLTWKEAACSIIFSVTLDIISLPCFILVIIFWGLFGAYVGNPNGVSKKDSFIIAAFVFSLIAFLLSCIGLIITIISFCWKRITKKQLQKSKKNKKEAKNLEQLS